MAKRYELRLGGGSDNKLDGGICYEEETNIKMNQSPFDGMVNMFVDGTGILRKRPGTSWVSKYPTDAYENVNYIYHNYKGWDIVHSGYKLYKMKLKSTVAGENEFVHIPGISLANKRSCIFCYNEILYILDGVNYYQYDGTTAKEVIGYYPIVAMNMKPDGSSSTVYESWNLISSGFRNTFNSDGTSKIYKLSLTNIDNTPVIVKVNGNVVATSEYTVDYNTSTITFTTAPLKGDNNVEITAFRTFSGLKDNIIKCTMAQEFSSRMFFSGNPTYPNTYYAGGLTSTIEANYFPQKYLYKITSSDRPITGLKVHQNTLIVFKSDCICKVNAAEGLNNDTSFPIQYINSEIGCNVPRSIQIIENALFFANTQNGVYSLTSTQIENEKSIKVISHNVNGSIYAPGLLQEKNLKDAFSVDYKEKYYLCVDNRIYVMDYKNGYSSKDSSNNVWYLWDNVYANCFAIVEGNLLFGEKGGRGICEFVNGLHRDADGVPISAKWETKLLDFGYADYTKLVSNMWITLNSNGANSNIHCTFYNNKKIKEADVVVNATSRFAWNSFSWDKFNWIVRVFDTTVKKKIRVKNINYFKISIDNNKEDEDLKIKSIVLEYRLLRKVR